MEPGSQLTSALNRNKIQVSKKTEAQMHTQAYGPRGAGEGAAPQFQKVLKIFRQNADDSDKSTGRKHSKRYSRPGL